MKKIISLILTLTILLSCSVFSFAEEEILMDKATLSAATLLKVVGIMEVDEGNFQTDITRQEFAKVLFKLLTNSDVYTEDYSYSVYSDVTDSVYIGYVNEMARLGVINGYSDGTFRPEREITLTEAVTFIIRSVGYDIKAEANGGYPTGYLHEANRAGLLKGVLTDSDTYLTFGECAKLIKNTLLAKFQQKGSFSTDGSFSYSDSEYTILKSVYRIDVIRGVVNGIDMTKLSGESTVKPWHILIGDKELDIGSLEPREYLGYNVEAYYTIDDDILKHIEPSSTNITYTFDIKDIYSIDTVSNIITQKGYYKNTEHRYTNVADFIYNNGISNSPFTIDMFDGKMGALTLIDNNGDKKYDVIKADVYFDIVCDYVDISEKKVYDLLTGSSYNIDTIPENPFVEVFDANGGVLDITSINKYDILSVYETLPEHEQKYVKYVVSQNKVTGTVSESAFDENGRKIVVINGDQYIFTDTALNYYGSSFDAGKKHIFVLNAEGYIAAVRENATEVMSLGMIIHYYIEEEALDKTVYVIYMNSSGGKQTAGLRKWVTIDNIKYKNDDPNLLKHIDKSSDVDFGESARCNGTQVIKYQLDSSGNLAYIDTILNHYDAVTDTAYVADEFSETDTYNALRKGNSNSDISSSSTFYWGAQSYDGKVFIDSNTKAFVGPYRNLNDIQVYKDTDNYRVGSFSGYNDHYSSYYDNPGSYLATMVLQHRIYSVSDGASGYSVTYSVFDKYTEAVNDEGQRGYKIYYWEGKNYKSDFASLNAGWNDSSNKLGEGKIKITPDKLKQGDVLRFSRNQNGDIHNYRICYRAEGDILIEVYDTGNWYSSEKLFAGYLFKKYNDGASYTRLENVSDIALDSDVLYFNKNIPVLLYNPEEKAGHKISVDSFNSGQYYLTDGDRASRVIVNTKSGNPYAVYIIKR